MPAAPDPRAGGGAPLHRGVGREANQRGALVGHGASRFGRTAVSTTPVNRRERGTIARPTLRPSCRGQHALIYSADRDGFASPFSWALRRLRHPLRRHLAACSSRHIEAISTPRQRRGVRRVATAFFPFLSVTPHTHTAPEPPPAPPAGRRALSPAARCERRPPEFSFIFTTAQEPRAPHTWCTVHRARTRRRAPRARSASERGRQQQEQHTRLTCDPTPEPTDSEREQAHTKNDL